MTNIEHDNTNNSNQGKSSEVVLGSIHAEKTDGIKGIEKLASSEDIIKIPKSAMPDDGSLSAAEELSKLKEKMEIDRLFQKGEDLASKKKYEEAIEAFIEIIKKYPNNKNVLEAKFRLGKLYFDTILKARLRLGELYVENKQYEEAENMLKQYLDGADRTSLYNFVVFFTYAESLFAQYKSSTQNSTEISGLRLKGFKARDNFRNVSENGAYVDIGEIAKIKMKECELMLSANDFFHVETYKKQGKYRAAVKRLDTMRVDFAGNKEIIDEIEKIYPELRAKYEKQLAQLKQQQLPHLKRQLAKYEKQLAQLKSKKPKLEQELEDFKKITPKQTPKDIKAHETNLQKLEEAFARNSELILSTESILADLVKNFDNGDLDPNLPDPDEKYITIFGKKFRL